MLHHWRWGLAIKYACLRLKYKTDAFGNTRESGLSCSAGAHGFRSCWSISLEPGYTAHLTCFTSTAQSKHAMLTQPGQACHNRRGHAAPGPTFASGQKPVISLSSSCVTATCKNDSFCAVCATTTTFSCVEGLQLLSTGSMTGLAWCVVADRCRPCHLVCVCHHARNSLSGLNSTDMSAYRQAE